jgi:6-pyruvoyltetrahydropterin/6-carboxytetrahydropterin synthase
MPKIRITKRFHFEMAHMLHAYEGPCRNIHGHSYILEVTLAGEPLISPGNPRDGMIMDFGELKNMVKEHIISRFDHALVINSLIPEEQQELLAKTSEKLLVVDFQPTTENIAGWIAGIVQEHLPKNVAVYSVRLYETGTSFAEWFAGDNT